MVNQNVCVVVFHDQQFLGLMFQNVEGRLLEAQKYWNLLLATLILGFSTLVEEFRHFKLQVVQCMNNHNHGTFEWVDGMLVQALEAGDWLLMDNVNFCR